jgi:hypothetical protein
MENYWLINTKDLSKVKNTFIGYTVTDDGNIILNEIPDKVDGTGAYTFIKVLEDKIEIYQDFLGIQGIYHYKNNDFSVFSNGYDILVDYLIKSNLKLTFNRDYATQYIFSNEEAVNINDTLIKEISRLAKNIKVEIDLKGNIEFRKINYIINTIKLDTKEAIDILDTWYNKWCKVFRNLAKYHSPFLLDLSGGFDSRMLFGIFLNSNINKNNIIIKRNVPKKISYSKNYDDWEISQEIIDKYDYNDRSNNKYCQTVKSDKNDLSIMKDLTNIVFGNSKICNYDTPTYDKPIFHIVGVYGDRTHLGDFTEVERYLDHKKKKYEKDMKKNDLIILQKMIDINSNIIINQYKEANAELFLGDFSFDYIQRFLGGKMTKNIFNNDINISPFADPLFHKIKIYVDGTKNYFGMASLIFIRYFEDLINFRFQTDAEPRIINEEEKLFAKNMCEKYPFQKINYEEIQDNSNNKVFIKKSYDKVKIREYLKEVLMKGKDKFIKIFNEDYFELAINDLQKENIKMQNYLTPIVSICYILNKIN